MTRACIYARYSTDRQTESSVEDQIRLCRRRADAQGWDVVATHSDSAISGSTHVDDRPGGAAMLDDAWAGEFDILLLEGLDRLSRDQVEQERIVRRLEYRGLRIVGVADGYDSTMGARKVLRSVRGLINEMYIEDLRHKTHRGQAGQVSRGFVAGGKSYGYDLVKGEHGSTYRVNEDQARWVRWIFAGYAEGSSVQTLAHELNRLGVPSPRGTTWAVSALYGSPDKGSGILNNTLYIGRSVWNRSRWVKDPDTAKRTRQDRPESEWQTVDVPDLRIIDDATWGRVRARIGTRRNARSQGGRLPRTLFGGLLVCPHCGGAVVAVNAKSYGCAARKDRGPTVCKGILIRRDLVDGRLVSEIRDKMLSPAAAVKFESMFRRAVVLRTANRAEERQQAQALVDKLSQDIARVVDVLVAVGASDALTAKLRRLEGKKEEAVAVLASIPDDAVEMQPPPVSAIFRRALLRLTENLETDTELARAALERILGPIYLKQKGDQIWAEMQTGRTLLESDLYLTVVAGTGFEPVTFGL